MSKFRRDRHVPLSPDEKKVLDEQFNDFAEDVKKAGARVKTLREEAGLSCAQLGEKLGLDAAHVEKIEAGEQPLFEDQAKILATLFQKDYRFFL